MRWLLVALAFLLLPTSSFAIGACPGGTLFTAQALGGVSDAFLPSRSGSSIAVQATATAGTATATLEVCCAQGAGACAAAGANWAPAASGLSLNASSAPSLTTLVADPPICQYRLHLTACSSCTVNAWFMCGAP